MYEIDRSVAYTTTGNTLRTDTDSRPPANVSCDTERNTESMPGLPTSGTTSRF